MVLVSKIRRLVTSDIAGDKITTDMKFYIIGLNLKFGMHMVISQFVKHVDPDLPFYYHTSTQARFYKGCHPEFDKKLAKPQKAKKYQEENSQLHLFQGELQCH